MRTRLIRGLHNLTPATQGGVVTIGNFDGVHLGHQALLKQLTAVAKQHCCPSTVITFEPHPLEFFHHDQLAIPRITRLREKFFFLTQCGLDQVLVINFNRAFAQLSAQAFVLRVLVEGLKVKHIIVGEDFHFGHRREGDSDFLRQWAVPFDYTVETLPQVTMNHTRISSSCIRQALLAGDLDAAREMLGRPYSMLGRITTGDQLGRAWGFPTANIDLHRKLTPVRGVYTVLMSGIAKQPLPGVANVGNRPTVDGTRTLLEVHLLDFNQDIYGCDVQVTFCKKLRDEIRYANLDLLRAQIADDVMLARNYFKQNGVL